MNTIYKVQRVDNGNIIEPNALVIRTYGGIVEGGHDPAIREEKMKLTIAEEILVFSEMSRRKQCPKLLGIFEGGRIEVFVKMRFIKADEVISPLYMEDIAKAFARMHSLNVPLNRTKWEPFWKKAELGYKNKPFSRWLRPLAAKHGYDVNEVCSINYYEELLWIKKVRQKYFNSKSRDAFIQADAHYMNLVVNEEPKEDELKVFLLDYELNSYGPRGIDLGGHFFNRPLDFSNHQNMATGKDLHTEEEKRKFLHFYQKEVKKLGFIKNFDENGLDSVDNLLFESHIGGLLYHLFFSYIAFNLTGEKTLTKKPDLISGLITFGRIYLEAKKRAIQIYPFLEPKWLV